MNFTKDGEKPRMATDQLLAVIRTLADELGLPDGLDYSDGWKLLCFCDEGGSPPYGVDPEESQLFPCWLAAALAHWETVAEDRHDISVLPGGTEEHPNFFISIRGIPLCGSRKYTPGDLLSRLSARTLALLDGVNADRLEN